MSALVQFSQPCVQVSAYGTEPCAGKQPSQLCDTAHAARADGWRLAQMCDELVDRSRLHSGRARQNNRIERILPRQDGGNGQTCRQDRRHVLAAVHGQIDLMSQERILDFFDEQPFAADVRQRRLLKPIAGGLNHDDAARRTAGAGDTRGHGVRLPQSELTAARPEAKFSCHRQPTKCRCRNATTKTRRHEEHTKKRTLPRKHNAEDAKTPEKRFVDTPQLMDADRFRRVTV